MGEFIVDNHVAIRLELLAPTDHDLAVDEPLVNPEQENRHWADAR